MILGRRRSRLLAAIWVLAGLALVASAVLLWMDRGRVTWYELPLAVVALWVGIRLGRHRVVLDRHGVEYVSWFGSGRTLWASIDEVQVQDTWWQPALAIVRKGDGEVRAISTTSGMRASQRAAMFEALFDLSRAHGFTMLRDGVVAGGGHDDDTETDDDTDADDDTDVVTDLDQDGAVDWDDERDDTDTATDLVTEAEMADDLPDTDATAGESDPQVSDGDESQDEQPTSHPG